MRVQFRYEAVEDLGDLLQQYANAQQSERQEVIALDELRVERWLMKEANGHYMRPLLHLYFIWDPVLHRRLVGKPLKPSGDVFSLSARKCIERTQQEHQDLLAEFESLLQGVETALQAAELGAKRLGDDDLFINKVANKDNTAIVVDPDTFTMSEPKKTFGEWFRQKTRHYSTAKYYRPLHKFLLGSYSISHVLFYPLFIASLFFDWRFSLVLFGIRLLVQGYIYYKAMNKLNENDLFAWWWLLDIWMFVYYLIFVPTIWKKPRATWN